MFIAMKCVKKIQNQLHVHKKSSSHTNYQAIKSLDMILGWFDGPRLEMLKRWHTENGPETKTTSTCRLDPSKGWSLFVFLSKHRSDQMSEESRVSKVILCVQILKWLRGQEKVVAPGGHCEGLTCDTSNSNPERMRCLLAHVIISWILESLMQGTLSEKKTL